MHDFISFFIARFADIPSQPRLKLFVRFVPARRVNNSSLRSRDRMGILIAKYTLSLVGCATHQEIRAVVCRDRANPKRAFQVINEFTSPIFTWPCFDDDMIPLA